MKRDFKKLYNCLLESEDLYLLSRNFTGVWEKDQDKFIKAQLEQEKAVNFIETEINDEE